MSRLEGGAPYIERMTPPTDGRCPVMKGWDLRKLEIETESRFNDPHISVSARIYRLECRPRSQAYRSDDCVWVTAHADGVAEALDRLATYLAPFGVHPAELLPANGGTMTGCKMEFEKGA